MRVFNIILTAVLLSTGIAFAKDEVKDLYKEAERLVDAGDYAKAEEILKKLISSEPNNAGYHKLLGDAYRKGRKLEDALKKLCILTAKFFCLFILRQGIFKFPSLSVGIA